MLSPCGARRERIQWKIYFDSDNNWDDCPDGDLIIDTRRVDGLRTYQTLYLSCGKMVRPKWITVDKSQIEVDNQEYGSTYPQFRLLLSLYI